MSFEGRSLEEREAASIVAGLHCNTSAAADMSFGCAAAAGAKRGLDAPCASERKASKKKSSSSFKKSKAAAKRKVPPPMDATGLVFAQPELKPPPYFYYTDHSTEQDDDPLTPITVAGSVPTFPAKMHAILTNPDLADVVGWAPHGRSWRILKPRDFEIRILPKYFEHSKFSSFVRQANGWGFRRVSQGYDKNAYYHEYFLRSMPWLCKKMRRPKVAEKKAVDPDMEPDLDAISLQRPVPDRPPTREVLVVQQTIELGPKARMPVMWDTGSLPAAPSFQEDFPRNASVENLAAVENLAPVNDSSSYNNLKQSSSYGDLKPAAIPPAPAGPPPSQLPVPSQVVPSAPQATQDAGPAAVDTMYMGNFQVNSTVAAASNQNYSYASNQNNRYAPSSYAMAAAPAAPSIAPSIPQTTAPSIPQVIEAPQQNSGTLSSDSHFAAGFMAATALHSNQIRNVLSTAFAAGMPIPEATSMVMPQAAATVPAAVAPNLGSAFNRIHIHRAHQMSQNNFAGMVENNNFHILANPNTVAAANFHIQAAASANPTVAAMPQATAQVTAGGNLGYGANFANNRGFSQQSSLSQYAMRRLQQFQAHQDGGLKYKFP